MEPKQGTLWDEEYLDSFIVYPENYTKKKDLTSRVELSYKFNRLREPLDFNELVNLGIDEYSKLKLPKMLITSLSEYHEKKKENVDFVDLAQMYYSLLSVFDGNVDSRNLKKWRKANKLSRFGLEQYNIMDKYFKKKMDLI